MVLLALLLAADPGALAGKVTLSGLAPKLANLPVTRDMKVCGANKPDELLEVSSGGGVKNVVIWFTDVPLSPDSRPGKEKLDQQQCMFVPHVLVAPVGATVEVVNSDKALHQVRAQAGDFRLMNYAMPVPGHLVPTKLTTEGIFSTLSRMGTSTDPTDEGAADIGAQYRVTIGDDSKLNVLSTDWRT